MTPNIKKTIINIFTISLLFIIPDILFSFFNEAFKTSHDLKCTALIVPLALGLALNKYKWFSIFIISLLCILQIMQFCHIGYFGTQMSPYSLHLMTGELEDVIEETLSIYKNFLYIIPIVTIPFISIFYVSHHLTKCKKSFLGTLIMLIVLGCIGTRLYRSPTPRFTPNEVRFTIDNSIKAFFGYWIIHLKKYSIKEYKPYEIIEKNTPTGPINVVYIIGESVNHKHMSIFGYPRKTTPFLKELSLEPNFYYTQAIAGSISTVSSCKFLTNVICEADNVIQTALDTTNLFKLAKAHGFKTFYISSQTEHLLSSIGGIGYIDTISTKDTNPLRANELMDEYILETLDSQMLGDKNFIVLHQRCIHTPYTKTFSKNYKNKSRFRGSKKQIIDEYDNAMVYNDYLISKMFHKFNKQKNGKFYIIWTSDHNELMGEKGLFGHGHGYLIPETAEVPLLIQSNDSSFLESIKQIFKPTHYELAKNIALILGFEVKNPNEENDTFYISGIDYNGKCGYIRLIKNLENKTISYHGHDTKKWRTPPKN